MSEIRFTPGFDKMHFELNFSENTKILSDHHRVKMIVSNLITNAIKYHDPAKQHNEIRIRFEQDDNYWCLEVYDNGIGIDSLYLSRVFDLFYRATEHAKGSGLGLYIVKEAVEKMHGEVVANSEIGKWSSFSIKIPQF